MKAIKLIDSTIEILSSNDSLCKRYNSEIGSLEQYKAHWRQDKIRIGVIGVTSSGKSTMINSILGDKLLSMAVKPSSSQLVSCSQSENKMATVFFENHRKIQLKDETLNEANIKRYSDENYNANNKEKVAQIELSTPTFELGEDVLLIDSPGLDAYGLENHEELTLEVLLPTIDVCIFVTTLKNNSDEKMKSVLNLIAKYKCQVVIVQNMLDSLRPTVDGKKTIEDVALEHKTRVQRIIDKSDIENKDTVKTVQIAAIQALKARCDNTLSKDERESLLNKSNYKDFIFEVKEMLKREKPNIENQRLTTVINRINKIISDGKEDVGLTVNSRELKFEYENLDIEIQNRAKNTENKLYRLLDSLENRNSGQKNSTNALTSILSRFGSNEREYTEADIRELKESVKTCEKNIIKAIADFNDYLRTVAKKLNIPPRDIVSVNGLPSMPDIKLKTKVETTERKVKKSGFGGKVSRLFGKLFSDDWGYEYEKVSVTVIDNVGTRREVEDYINRAKKMYIREIETWTKKTRVPIDQLMLQIENRCSAFEERRKAVIEGESLINAVESLYNLSKNVKFENTVRSGNVENINPKAHIILKKEEFDLKAYNIAKMADKVSNLININTNKLLLDQNNGLDKNWIIVGWDIISISTFAKRFCEIILKEDQLRSLELDGHLHINKYKFYFNPSKECTKEFMNRKVSINIYILTNATQYGSAQNQIYKCGIGAMLLKDDFLAFVIQDFIELINGGGVIEAIQDMMLITQHLKIDHKACILINHHNPIYNLTIIETQINPTSIEKEETEILNKIQRAFRYLRDESIDNNLSDIIRGTSKKERY